jgi:succinate dehydrogenase/fumarate reductase flavoprotein subunit
VLGNALAARLLLSARKLGIPIHLGTPASELLVENQQVKGVLAGSRRIRARRGVVIATGGFPGNPELRARHMPHADQHWTVAPSENIGDGIALAEGVGAQMAKHNAHNGFWTPVSLVERKDGSTSVFPHLITERAKPGVIAVDAHGKRFVDEACSYHDFVNAMHAGSVIPAFLIFDRRALQRYGVGHARPWPFPKRQLIRSGYLVKAGTLAGLAETLGLPKDTFEKSVARYNSYARKGEDPDFGKGSSAYGRYLGDPDQKPNPCLAPIENAPFYAVRVFPGSIGTSRGLVTNASAEVLGRNGQPIEGLYACGNDMNSIMGGHYPGPGITLGPALTFGYIAAMHMAHGRQDTKEELADALCNTHPG